MEQAIQMNIGGIKCDTPDCEYRDDSVEIENYKNYVNKPCPECGGNLLTEVDFENVQQMISYVNLMNGILPPAEPTEEKAVLTVEMNGTGTMDMKIKEYKQD